MDIAAAARLCFAADYASARTKFRLACETLGVPLRSYENPKRGPAGEALATDVAWIGPADARFVVGMLSGTHGVEGFCGSGAQVDWLLDGGPASLPRDTAVLLVHAVNPFGWAWLSRTTEENVDLNRNWIDFTAPLPDNAGYEELALHLVPSEFEGAARAAADAALAAWRTTRSEEQWFRAVSSGQYRHETGMFFGGRGPTWSRRTEEAIIADHRLGGREAIAIIDMHTGLGPYGYGEPISHMPASSPARARVMRIWGESVTEPARGTSVSTLRTGLTAFGWRDLLGERLAFVTLEFGTFARDQVVEALRGDCWTRAQGLSADDPRQARIRAATRRAFYPDTDSWRELVLFRARQCTRQALAGVGEG
ncbi:MAG: M14 family metallopeptidase [Alphaproteobacteria bacterium]|nr:M14 family metallopeptidase [Alphaproteobacteria bacterium]